MKESLFWFGVLAAYLAAFSVLAFLFALTLGVNGVLSGYLGWVLVLALLIPELDQETRDALKRWAVGKKKKD